MIPNRKKTSTNLSVGCNSNAAAVSAKRMRNRRDDSDLSDAIVEAITPRGLAAFMRNFYQWPVFRHAMKDFIQSYDRLRRPDPIFLQRHKFNEAHDHAFFSREQAKRNDLIFIEAAHQHTIDFHRPQSNPSRLPNSRKHIVESVRYSSDAGKAVRIDCIHTDGHATQAGIFEGLRHLGKEMPVRGDG